MYVDGPCACSSTRGSHNGCYMVTRVTQILKLVNAFQTKDCLYLVLEFLQGGDIFGHLYKQGGKFTSRMAIFYTSIGTTQSHPCSSPPIPHLPPLGTLGNPLEHLRCPTPRSPVGVRVPPPQAHRVP